MDYSQFYDKDYYETYGTAEGAVSYKDNPDLLNFYRHFADKIVEDLKPKTFLDIGCAMGLLVTALRDRGVEAYGIDVSEYAISQIREDVRKFCRAQSALEDLPADFPKRFDVVSCIEMIEHLEEPDGLALIQKMCGYSDRILLSSTPDDEEEPTHLNVQQPEYWVKHFAPYRFLHQLDYDVTYISKQALCFYHAAQKPLVDLIEDYERHHRLEMERVHQEYTKIVEDQKTQIDQLKTQLEDLEDNFDIVRITDEFQINKLKAQLSNYRQALEGVTANRDHYLNLYVALSNSRWWKLTKPGRALLTGVKKGLYHIPILRKLVRGLRLVRTLGLSKTFRKIKYRKLLRKYIPKNSLNISEFMTAETAVKQLQTTFDGDVKFSILVPLYNTPIQFLREMIDSCINQTYQNWELCLADASDRDDGEVKKICEQYAAKDSRIHYRKLAENKGISENTNAAIEMITGNFVSLLDHDDLLHPATLFEVRKQIAEQGADFIYTDELTFGANIHDVQVVHLKPDFAIDNLRSNNYICHFSTFRKDLLDQVGKFNPECDGSQDYDIILRLTEQAKQIVHIPKVLYFWRSHPGSVASDLSVKPYCMEAAKRALNHHLKRVGLKGEAMDAPNALSIYRIRYQLKATPLVSILIPSKDHVSDLNRCIKSIVKHTTYPNYEIIVIENNSTDSKTFAYYETLKRYDNVRVVTWQREFNYSAINNYAVTFAKGDYYLFLNNDVAVISPEWIEEMLMLVQRDDVGAAGAKLYYPDNTIQHAGLGLGLISLAGHLHRGFDRNHIGYMGRLSYTQNVSGVTAACMLVKKSVYEEVGGFDEALKVAFNDVDFCLKIRQAGYLICFTPYAELYHYESRSRGNDLDDSNYKRFQSEMKYVQKKWKTVLEQNDPYFNPNFNFNSEDFSVQTTDYSEL